MTNRETDGQTDILIANAVLNYVAWPKTVIMSTKTYSLPVGFQLPEFGQIVNLPQFYVFL